MEDCKSVVSGVCENFFYRPWISAVPSDYYRFRRGQRDYHIYNIPTCAERSQSTTSQRPTTARYRPLLPIKWAEEVALQSGDVKTRRRMFVAASYTLTEGPIATLKREPSRDHDTWVGCSPRKVKLDRGTQESANTCLDWERSDAKFKRTLFFS